MREKMFREDADEAGLDTKDLYDTTLYLITERGIEGEAAEVEDQGGAGETEHERMKFEGIIVHSLLINHCESNSSIAPQSFENQTHPTHISHNSL